MSKKVLVLVAIICILSLVFMACDKPVEEPVTKNPVDEHTCTFDKQVVDPKYLASEANCAEAATYYYSCECGEKGIKTFANGDLVEHTFSNTYTHDATHHWYKATCAHSELTTEKVPHELNLESDGLKRKCVCGYFEDCIVDVDVILEAEDAVLNPNHISVDEKAHGGKYGLGFNDCGQGMYFRYYAYEAGEKEIEVAYATSYTSAVCPYMNMYVNGGEKVKVEFQEDTGWFGDNGGVTAIVKVKATFIKGWNEIYLIKDGNGDDMYGQFAQIDYIKVLGSNKDFTGEEFDRTARTYKLECETAEWHWANDGQRPTKEGAFSNGYYCGEMNAPGDGVKFTYKVQNSGTYKLQLAFGKGGDVQVDVKLNGELLNEGNVMTNASTGWNDVQLDNSGIEVVLDGGEEFVIEIIRTNDWFVPDYLLLTLVE